METKILNKEQIPEAVALMEGEHDLMGCDRSMCMLWKNGYVDRIRRTVQEINEKYWNV